jgi:hypothetical protein
MCLNRLSGLHGNAFRVAIVVSSQNSDTFLTLYRGALLPINIFSVAAHLGHVSNSNFHMYEA